MGPERVQELRKMKIEIEARKAYGLTRVYPVGEGSEYVRALTRRETVSRVDVVALEALGVAVEWKSIPALQRLPDDLWALAPQDWS